MLQSDDTYRHYLRQLPEFCDFTEAEFSKLTHDLSVKTYPKGQILFDHGDLRQRFYYVIKGVVRLERHDETGNFTFINYVKAIKGFPYRGLYTDADYPYTATALTDITIASVPMTTFEAIVSLNPLVTRQVISQMSHLLDRMENRLQKLVTSSATNRVIQALSIFGSDMGEKTPDGDVLIPYPITLIELARLSGTTRETAGQVVTKLEVAGKLIYNKKRFRFDPSGLTG
ncbi:Crp/Fnr family transcriptional regulator [Lactobacillus sp. LC28-10]|uniref:Crp/Fnr family transcriptional regulator n=1 Tax=Secundilactobacillus angelensis TaxID=2722706 RepID=A0ABX1L0L0_9LACO|nr:Crp/Fnr family transcriptional regulator [Secundilactobacillus angelensis]MCH5463107.1 Crp/Fnr family transcriptional regulator [Secundilactobacillus angelensis]NLR18960.1 Crp/Fnr family transcriptional regulator [Secundilactobacillus angelensis]